MIIGVPRERKTLEQRVALTPDGAHDLVALGHKVLIEKDAGKLSHYPDNLYQEAGAEIVPDLKSVWTKADMVVKVKEPHEEEYQYFREGLVVFDYLHLAGLSEVSEALNRSKVTGIAYELVQLENGRLPLLEPMSEVAGKLSVLNGSYFLLAQNGGRGVLLGGTVGVTPANVVIVGAGIAGRAACTVALGMGAKVTVLDVNYTALDKIRAEFHGQAATVFSTTSSLARACAEADLVISAVLVPGAAAPKLFTKKIIQGMPKGSVFVDISIDQGGSAESSRTTSLKEPVYEEFGVIHYAVPNMPAQTARTSTQALTSATLPYVKKLANLGADQALKTCTELGKALCTYNGFVTNKAVHDAIGGNYKDLETVLKSF
jgi:alanine dehydrogenase